MLYKVNIPDCREHFKWIVALQHRLLKALCTVNASQVTENWIVKQLDDLDVDWVQGFCRKKDSISNSKQSLLVHMQQIASFDDAIKEDILKAFENDIKFSSAFDHTSAKPFQLIGVNDWKDRKDITKAVRGFFEIFYAPTFYKNAGYFITLPNQKQTHFHKDEFLQAFREANDDVEVCVMCDGSLGKPEVDHFYPKGEYPTLSCHYLNLIPICKDCNSRSVKGEKLALKITQDPAEDPFEDWFHPYLRPAAGNFQLQFRRQMGKPTPLFLSDDPKVQIRLDNMADLFKLQERWQKELSSRVKATIRKIRKYQDKLTSKKALKENLYAWAEDMECEHGLIPFSILERYYLLSAAQEIPEVFDELWVVASGADAVTAQNPSFN